MCGMWNVCAPLVCMCGLHVVGACVHVGRVSCSCTCSYTEMVLGEGAGPGGCLLCARLPVHAAFVYTGCWACNAGNSMLLQGCCPPPLHATKGLLPY